MTRESRSRALLYALFTLSGFAGLIYESIWSHYLKLFLGHAAYAQTLVLVIFMGGMAAGSWLAGRWTDRIRNPLRLYATVEAILGFGALAFDPVFRGMQAWMFDSVIPALGSPLAIDLCKWSSSALIVLPQSVLLGATFPLISAGVLRFDTGNQGRALGWLYFTNSLGASVGVLVSGFYLIATAGLPGTIAFAGMINFALAAIVLLIARTATPTPPSSIATASTAGAKDGIAGLMLAVAALTGAASFCYEIGWIRMLSLVLGSATHAFELMLSAFILGIAIGSFLIRARIDRISRPLQALGWIQLAMATAAFLTIPLYNQSFDWMAFTLHALNHSDQGYLLFNVISHAICMALMLPVTIFAGMTLPLITATLLRRNAGESSIGRVYASNTLGSIVGVLLAVHVVMPLLGLRQVIIIGALVDLSIGLWLLAASGSERRAAPRLAWLAPVAIAVAITGFVRFEPGNLASGVFRYGVPNRHADYLYHRDGKTASVDVYRSSDTRVTIATNGKPDATIKVADHADYDDYTMILSGMLPILEKPDARRAAVIGIGSGRTTHTLLADPQLTVVDTVEIEPSMAAGARLFGELTHRTFDDPRSHLHFEDAKTYFARNRSQYDVIVAEPSNPWVSGVASLFSDEFYHQIKRYLTPGGLFVQWLQAYEIDTPLMTTIVNALGKNFDDYAIYAAYDLDVVIVASPHGPLPPLSTAPLADPAIAQALDYIDLRNLADVESRRIGSRRTLEPFFKARDMPTNSDYRPILDQLAVKQRFLQHNAKELTTLRRVSARLESPQIADTPLAPQHGYTEGSFAEQSQLIPAWLDGQSPLPPGRSLNKDSLSRIAVLRSMDTVCDAQTLTSVWLPAFRGFALRYLPYLSTSATNRIATYLRGRPCYAQAPQPVRDWIDFFAAAGTQDWHAVQTHGEELLKQSAHDAEGDELLARELLLADIRSGDFKAATAHAEHFDAAVFRNSPSAEYLRAYAAAQ